MIVMSIGVFDGVHVGHETILKMLIDMGRRKKAKTLVLTILYPMDYYRQNFDGLITSVTERISILQERIDMVETLDLIEVKDLDPHTFFKEWIEKREVVGLVVGEDFKFGKGGVGDVNLLEKLCKDSDIELVVARDVKIDGRRVSSSVIRRLVREGKVEEAARFLGRPFRITGKVYRDTELGHKIGFPTANIDRGHEFLVIPRFGVYSAKVTLPWGEERVGVANIGTRPTIGGEDVKYEVHILDFDGDLYGRFLEMNLIKFLRPEKKFRSLEELKEAISEDVKKVKEQVEEFLV